MGGFKIKEQVGYDITTAEMETLEAIAVLGDPGADRILFWDESANTWKFLTVGTGLTITDTTISSAGMENPMHFYGDIIYGGNPGGVPKALHGNEVAVKKFLISEGVDMIPQPPSWGLTFSTDVALGSSDTIVPSQNAVKTYADNLVVGLIDYRGAYDASGNTWPATGGSGTGGAVMKGDMWIISVAGTLGGEAVQVGDSIIASVDTPGQTASNWNHLNGNISYVPENVANKVTSISGSSTDTQYPSAKLLYDQLALKLSNIVEDTTPQLGGELDCQAHSIGFTQGTATGDGTTTIDWKLGNKFYFTFGNANETFTFTAPSKACNLILVLKQYSTGGKTATWPNTVMWPGGTAPTLSTGNNAIDIVSFYFDGTNYFGQSSLNFSVPA